jgi:hypothetical protein
MRQMNVSLSIQKKKSIKNEPTTLLSDLPMALLQEETGSADIR